MCPSLSSNGKDLNQIPPTGVLAAEEEDFPPVEVDTHYIHTYIYLQIPKPLQESSNS